MQNLKLSMNDCKLNQQIRLVAKVIVLPILEKLWQKPRYRGNKRGVFDMRTWADPVLILADNAGLFVTTAGTVQEQLMQFTQQLQIKRAIADACFP